MLKTAVSVAVLLKLDVLLEGDVIQYLDDLPMTVSRRHTPLYYLVVLLPAEIVMSVVMSVVVAVVMMSVVVEVTVVPVGWTAVLVTVVLVSLAAVRGSDYH